MDSAIASQTPSEQALEAMRAAAKTRGNQKEVDRCTTQIDIHRHAITKTKPPAQRRVIYSSQIKRLTEELRASEESFEKSKEAYLKDKAMKHEKITELSDLPA